MDRLDKLRGMLAGVFVGDALGAPHEFRNQKDVFTGIIQHRARFQFRHHPAKYMTVGQVTDDSEMTLILARRLLADGEYIASNVTLDYIEWANSKPAGIGRNTQYLFKGITAKDPNRRLATYQRRYNTTKVKDRGTFGFAGDEDSWTQSNGSLMRISPLVLLMGSDINSGVKGRNAIMTDTKLTNPHPINLEVNRIYTEILKLAIHSNLSPIKIYTQVLADIRNNKVAGVLNQITNDYNSYMTSITTDGGGGGEGGQQGVMTMSRDITKMKGWVLHAFYISVFAFLLFSRLDQALVWVIGLGGDTDTNGAIAGGLIGARLGWASLNTEEVTAYNIQKVLNANPCAGASGDESFINGESVLNVPRPTKYVPNDFMELTQGLADRFLN